MLPRSLSAALNISASKPRFPPLPFAFAVLLLVAPPASPFGVFLGRPRPAIPNPLVENAYSCTPDRASEEIAGGPQSWHCQALGLRRSGILPKRQTAKTQSW